MFKLNLPKAEVSRTLKKPCGRIWEVLTDTEAWPEWGPSVSAVECGDRRIRQGSRGRVRTAAGIWVPFVITRYEEEHFWSWNVAGIPATGHRVEPDGKGGCRVIFEVPFPAAPYAYVCRIALERIARMVEEGQHL